MTGHVLVVDQGTTSTRSIIFGPGAALVAMAQEEFPQIFPQGGWVEHDPESLWRTTLSTARQALSRAGIEPSALAGLGITNQRETTLVWSRTIGRPIHNAIVWQDRRTAPFAPNSGSADARRSCPSAPACCSIPIFRRRRSPGFSTMFPALALKRNAESWPSAPSTAFSYGA